MLRASAKADPDAASVRKVCPTEAAVTGVDRNSTVVRSLTRNISRNSSPVAPCTIDPPPAPQWAPRLAVRITGSAAAVEGRTNTRATAKQRIPVMLFLPFTRVRHKGGLPLLTGSAQTLRSRRASKQEDLSRYSVGRRHVWRQSSASWEV